MAQKMGITVEGLRPLFRRLNQLPKTAQREMREQAKAIAEDEAARIRSAAAGSDRQSSAVSRFVVARSDRVPAIVAGGNRKAGVSGGATAGELFFGAEFGGGSDKQWKTLTKTRTSRSGRTREVFAGVAYAGQRRRATTNQFRPWLRHQGYWMWPTLRADDDRMFARWLQALEGVEREWSRGGDV